MLIKIWLLIVNVWFTGLGFHLRGCTMIQMLWHYALFIPIKDVALICDCNLIVVGH